MFDLRGKKYVLVTLALDGIMIVDISEEKNPVIVGSLKNGLKYVWVSVFESGGKSYALVTSDFQLNIIDISEV